MAGSRLTRRPGRPGRLAPLVLPDADGQPVRLGTFWEQLSAVVVFLRHFG